MTERTLEGIRKPQIYISEEPVPEAFGGMDLLNKVTLREVPSALFVCRRYTSSLAHRYAYCLFYQLPLLPFCIS